jgi:hypothetical protein
MARDFAEDFYNGRPWRLTRAAYAREKHWICERCGGPAPVGLELEGDGGNRDDGRPRGIVHHRVHLTPENIGDDRIAYGFDNLELLCQACHNREHRRSGAISEGLTFDENGDVVRT